MKNYWPLILIVLLTGCLSTRNVSKKEDKFKGFETSNIQRTSPGDKIDLVFPRTPKDRPKSTTKTYKGENGATSKKTFNESGLIVKDEIDCPEINEQEQRHREWEHEQSVRETERKANIELANMLSKTLIWISAIWALAWVLKSVILRKG
jgi:hypothetical protein